MRQRHQRRERIEDAEIEVTGVERDDGRTAAVRQGGFECCGFEPAVGGDWQHVQLPGTDTQVAKRAIQRDVVERGGEYPDRLRPASPCSATSQPH